MHSELKAKLFLYLPSREASFYNQREAFGGDVTRKFHRASDDVESAGDCIALGMCTASVFHLMRVMERGVQRLGKKLGEPLSGEKNWQVILDGVNKAVKALPEGSPKLKARKAEYAAMAAHLYNVKVAWRNPVMHPKAKYSDSEATEIYENVKAFMRSLAPLV